MSIVPMRTVLPWGDCSRATSGIGESLASEEILRSEVAGGEGFSTALSCTVGVNQRTRGGDSVGGRLSVGDCARSRPSIKGWLNSAIEGTVAMVLCGGGLVFSVTSGFCSAGNPGSGGCNTTGAIAVRLSDRRYELFLGSVVSGLGLVSNVTRTGFGMTGSVGERLGGEESSVVPGKIGGLARDSVGIVVAGGISGDRSACEVFGKSNLEGGTSVPS